MDEPSKDDRAIREELMGVLTREPWSDMSHLNIVVMDGVVHFWGLVNSEQQREALKVAAENAVGVREIVDHMLIAATLTSPE